MWTSSSQVEMAEKLIYIYRYRCIHTHIFKVLLDLMAVITFGTQIVHFKVMCYLTRKNYNLTGKNGIDEMQAKLFATLRKHLALG